MVKAVKVAYEAGAMVKLNCSACDGEQDHLIRTVSKQKQVTKADCVVCETSNSFRNGVKTSVTVSKSKSAAPYDRTRKYRRGQVMLHSVFGLGEVTSLVEPRKIDVLFGDQTRRLIHEQV
ncbi:MAG: hypothetical protein IPN69_23505 [Acidobacteria bacterium]|nr:hypothetical protein [Acidobacteriota bacterium]MBK8151006.1 hypothetical protein [Acidobacteriota bacterium]MBK8813677.1 hypothetical protein [Acidobacteriota bacterium]